MDEHKQIRVIFAGRYQPFHIGHLAVYNHLCDKFGKSLVFIASSNKKGKDSPLTFKQKKKIACDIAKIPKNRFIKCKAPYVPDEILKKSDKSNTISIICLGSKDKDRLIKSKCFKLLPKNYRLNRLKTSDKVTYLYFCDMLEDNISATLIRNQLKNQTLSLKQKKKLFVDIFGIFDQDIFDTLAHDL